MILSGLRTSIVLRTTLVVLGATLAVGLLVMGVAEKAGRSRVIEQQREDMEAMLGAVEPSASVACVVDDHLLGEQVVQGLVGTSFVEAAVLRSGTRILFQASRAATTGASSGPTIIRPLYSPFSPGTQVGELLLALDSGETARQIDRTLALVRMVILSLALPLGLVLAYSINRAVIRPITALSHRLHHLEADTGAHLALPPGHEGDEIGLLVRDVNALVERLLNALGKERDLSEQLSLDKLKFKAILDNATTGIFVVRGDGHLEAWTPAFLRLLGLENAPTPAGVCFPVLFGMDAYRVDLLLARCCQEGTSQVEVLPTTDMDGQVNRWLQLTLDPIAPDWIQGLLTDVTSHREATAAAEDLALHDPLTGLLNRLGAERALAGSLERGGESMALMMVDLDFFKKVNDTFGHDAGDEVLRQAALRLKGVLRRSDRVVRLGGDEFLVLMDALGDEQTAYRIGEKVIESLNLPIPLPSGDEAHVGASVGIVLPRGEAFASHEALLKLADTAMYQAKQEGRNTCRVV